MVHKDKNTIKNTKSQPKKTICEVVNFGSIKLTKPKIIYRNITEWYNIFIIPLQFCYILFLLVKN